MNAHAPSSQKQTGAALISVLLLFALITILTAQLISQTQSGIERTRWLVSDAQAYQYALGGEILARQILWQQHQDLKAEGISISPVPQALPIYQPEYGEIAIEIVDLQGQLNLNNAIGSDTQKASLTRLFGTLLLKPELAQVLGDWVDADNTPLPGGAEDSAYLSLTPPYRTADRKINSSSELLALKGIDAELLSEIMPWLTALPEPTAINPNTASAEILSLLIPGLSGEQVLNFRETNPPGFLSVSEFLAADISAGLEINPELLTVSSRYYGLKIRASINDRNSWLSSIISIDTETSELTLQKRTLGKTSEFNHTDLFKTEQAEQNDTETISLH
ncbi:MAG: type II secretion system minor pseudopilin GspK [Porticoccaceae bacterium]|nr:type II secretion system minor pseudopilin GspK [Porticoccaceae bacterium]